MAAHSRQEAAAFTALALATGTALGYTIAWVDTVAPTGTPNTMKNTTWSVEDSGGTPIEFEASYHDLDTVNGDELYAQRIVERALGFEGYGDRLQTAFAAAAVTVAAADDDEAMGQIWAVQQDIDSIAKLT